MEPRVEARCLGLSDCFLSFPCPPTPLVAVHGILTYSVVLLPAGFLFLLLVFALPAASCLLCPAALSGSVGRSDPTDPDILLIAQRRLQGGP